MPTIPEHAKWAAVSVGDFAFPHVMTFNPPPSKVLKDGTLPILQALFEQEQLAALRKPESLAVDQLQLRDKLEEALRKLDQIPNAEKLAEKVVHDIDVALAEKERVEPKPVRVGESLESLTARPMADGSILSITRSLSVVTRDGVRADLDLGSAERFLFGMPMVAASDRTSCTSLAGGEVEVGDWRGVSWSADASTLVLSTQGAGDTIWTLATDPPGGCAWTKVGDVPRGRAGLDGTPVPWRGGKLARAGYVDGLGVISVTSPKDAEVQLGMLESTVLSDLVWLDDEHIAAIAHYEVDSTFWIALFSLRDTAKVVVVPASVAAGATGLSELAAIPGKNALLVTGYDSRLVRVELPKAVADVIATPTMATDKQPLVAEGRPTVYEIDPSGFTSKALTDAISMSDLTVSADGKRAAVTVDGRDIDPDAPGDGEIAVIDLDSGAMRLLTRNDLRDDDPHFTADGKYVVFDTRVELSRSDWTITAARIVPVDPQ
jgi:hypothetical protein